MSVHSSRIRVCIYVLVSSFFLLSLCYFSSLRNQAGNKSSNINTWSFEFFFLKRKESSKRLIPRSGKTNNRIFFLPPPRHSSRSKAVRSSRRIVNFLFLSFFLSFFYFFVFIHHLARSFSVVGYSRPGNGKPSSTISNLWFACRRIEERWIGHVTSCCSIVNQSWRISSPRLRPTRVHAYRYTSKYFSIVTLFFPPMRILPKFYQMDFILSSCRQLELIGR